MALYKKLNYATGTLASGIADDAVEVVLNAGHSITTDTGIDNNFIGVFFSESESSPYQDASREIVNAYRTDTNTFTITRAQEGTSAKAWSQGDNFMLIASAGVFDEYETELDAKAPLSNPSFTGNITLSNDKWIRFNNYAGTNYLNALKGTTSDELELGATLNSGTIEAETDAGAITLFDMPVSDAPTAGDEMSGTFKIDGNNILKIYSLADGAGGVDSFAVKLLNSAGLDITETAATTDTDKFLVSDSGRVKYRTGAEVLSDIGAQAALGYTAENVANKKTDLTDNSDTYYPTQRAVKTAVDAKLASADKATSAEINTGTENDKYITPDALAGSNAFTKTVQQICVDFATELAVADGVGYIIIPAECNGMNLISARADVITAGTTNASTFDIYNVTDSTSMLSSAISIASGAKSGTGTVDTAHDDVATGDLIRIDVKTLSTTKPKGLIVTLAFRLA